MNPESTIMASNAVALSVALVYAFLFITEKKIYIFHWATGWSFILFAYAARYAVTVYAGSDVLVFLNYFFTIAGYSFICVGTTLFLGVGIPGWSLYGFVSLCIVFFAGYMSGMRTLAAIPAVLFFSVIFIWLGLKLARSRKNKNGMWFFSGISFVLWGTAISLCPFFRVYSMLSLQLGYILLGTIGLLAAISLLAAYFENVKNDMLIRDNRIRYLGMYDKLTGAYNRAYVEERLEELEDRCSLPVSVIIGDLNNLKLINDIFGYQKGDELLENAVKILKKHCGENDFLARWGGDEFIMLLQETSRRKADKIVKLIKEDCRKCKLSDTPLDISFGLATREGAGISLRSVIKEADGKMYSNKLSESSKTKSMVIRFLENVLKEKDYETEEHILRLKKLAVRMGNFLSLSKEEIEDLSLAATLHDIGKIAVPDEILRKPEPLDSREWAIMKKHTEFGYRIAQYSRELEHVSGYILHHHEWWNGKGYPHGLKGESIPLYSRIVSIVDAYDVMIHDRPYKKATTKFEAVNEIKRCSGSQFDPELAGVFADMIQDMGL